jgi:hypothetical protein
VPSQVDSDVSVRARCVPLLLVLFDVLLCIICVAVVCDVVLVLLIAVIDLGMSARHVPSLTVAPISPQLLFVRLLGQSSALCPVGLGQFLQKHLPCSRMQLSPNLHPPSLEFQFLQIAGLTVAGSVKSHVG